MKNMKANPFTQYKDGLDDEMYLYESVGVNAGDIPGEMTRMPAALAYFNEQYADAFHAHMKAKVTREQTRATRLGEIKAMHEARKTKVTVDQLAADVDSDPEVMAVRDIEIEAESTVVRLKGVMEALRTKASMLQSLGAFQRLEMEATRG